MQGRTGVVDAEGGVAVDNVTQDIVVNDVDEETDVHTEVDVTVGEEAMTQTDVDAETETDVEEVVRVLSQP